MISLKTDNTFLFGSQYYRAPSPDPENWERDLKAMAGRGFNTVKYWVQWRWNNPREGVFVFDDIDRLMDLASRYGLRVMLNTIVDVAPGWVYRQYPDASMVTLDGRRIGPQVQPHRQIGGLGLCFNHQPAVDRMMEFLRMTARRYTEHPALEFWNVASEPELTSSMAELRLYADDASRLGDMLCYCGRCQEQFTTWLSEKYPSIDILNLSWNRNYGSFEEVEVPLTRNSFNDMIDWRMFFVSTIGDNVRRRFEAVREEDGGRHPLMCHHVFIQGFPLVSTANDPWNVGQFGDLHGITQMDDPAMCDVLRSCARGRPVISAEMLMLYGYTLDLPRPVGVMDVRRYVFTGVAANMKGFIFWQYRPEILAREAPAWGLTHLDGSSTPWLDAFAETGAVLQRESAFLQEARPRKAEVAILFCPENQIFAWAATGSEKTATDSLLGAHHALYRRNFVVDFVHSGEVRSGILRDYKVLVVPFPYFLDGAVCAELARWVRDGGVLIGECYFAGWDVERGRHHTTVPGYGLHALFKARQAGVSPVAAGDTVEMTTVTDLPHCPAGTRCRGTMVKESLLSEGAAVVATFPDGSPAVTHAAVGKGHAMLIGSYVAMKVHRTGESGNADLLAGLVAWKTDIRRPVVEGDPVVRVDILDGRDRRVMMIARNLSEEQVKTTVRIPEVRPGTLTELFTGEAFVGKATGHHSAEGTVSLDGREVRVFCG